MRKHRRKDLPQRVARLLDRRQQALNERNAQGAVDLDSFWNTSCRNQYIQSVREVLKSMSGTQERCMYCGDSHGTGIEHFWPKSRYPEKMFLWANLILCCSECNGIKSNAFPLGANGEPELIDPTVDMPWDFLDYDAQTGNITAKYIVAIGDFDPRGKATVFHLQLDHREGLSNVLRASYRRLSRMATESIANGFASANEFVDDDQTGLLEWFLFGNGARVAPFDQFLAAFPGFVQDYRRICH